MTSHKLHQSTEVVIIREDIVNHTLQIKALIQDIQQCGGPEDLLAELNCAVRSKMTTLKRRTEELEKVGREQDRDTDQADILKEVDGYRQQFSRIQSGFRKANVICQMAIEQANKDVLFSTENGDVRQRHRKDLEGVVRMSAGVTDHLTSISRNLAETVERSSETLGSLATSSSTLQETQDEFKSMGSVIVQSRKLLTKYGRREFTDKVLVFFALAFFFACVLYIIKKRLF